MRQASWGPPCGPHPGPPTALQHPHPQAHFWTALHLQPSMTPGGKSEAPDPAADRGQPITSSARSPSASPTACGIVGGEPDLQALQRGRQGFLDQPGRVDEQRRPSGSQALGTAVPEGRGGEAPHPGGRAGPGARAGRRWPPASP